MTRRASRPTSRRRRRRRGAPRLDERQRTTLGELSQHAGAIEAELERRRACRLLRYFLECGPWCQPGSPEKDHHRNEDGSQRWCWCLYPKHVHHFRGGAQHRERLFMAGNRVGKSSAGAFETALHLTGAYPSWWEGRRFTGPVRAWACGKTHSLVKDIVQEKLLGPVGRHGTGFLPHDRLDRIRMKPGTADAVASAWVRHAGGGHSVLQFKSYEEKRRGFEGTHQDVVWLDEEPPMAIYTECLVRTMGTADGESGIVYATFTPLDGLTELIQTFMPNGERPPDGVVPDAPPPR